MVIGGALRQVRKTHCAEVVAQAAAPAPLRAMEGALPKEAIKIDFDKVEIRQ